MPILGPGASGTCTCKPNFDPVKRCEQCIDGKWGPNCIKGNYLLDG